MKKALFLILLTSAVAFANAQVVVSFNNRTYNDNDTIKVQVASDYEFYPVYQNTLPQPIVAQATVTLLNDAQMSVLSMCTHLCVGGGTSTPFVIPGNGSYDIMHISFRVTSTETDGLFSMVVVDTASGATMSEVYVLLTANAVGIQEVDNSLTLSAYPNPATTQFTVDYTLDQAEGNAEVVLYNMQGQAVRRQAVSSSEGSTTLSVADLPAGVYMCSLQSNGRTSKMQKLVVR